ncbi:PKD domain-containing protein [Hymenobacter sp.]|uniref:PKD domain-containing protein n=1 Tax=Hymenobacter sp. TaxID=1898978 RepID=UPI00286A7EDE|nr:PKD domain-containing protein [Hymenobacter sp.]
MILRILILCASLALFSGPAVRAQAPPSGFQSTLVSGQWDEAVGLAFNKTGTQMFVWERPGRVWVVENNQRNLLLDISPEVGAWHDHGMLGFALHPQFDTNGYFYVFYVVDRHYLLNFGTAAYDPAKNDYFSATIGRLTRYTATKVTGAGGGYAVNPASRTILLGATKSTGLPVIERSHSTGSLAFGTDGTLLITTGDGANVENGDRGSDNNTYYATALADGIIRPQENVGALRSQMVNSLNGKILRIDPLTGAGVPSNPYYSAGNPTAPASKVWGLGLRNPFRMNLKPGSGSTNPADGNPGTLYIGDVGASTWEEADVVNRPGLNLGWPIYEGLTPNSLFADFPVANQDAPNPLFNVNGCTQQFFTFQNLLKRATPTGTAPFPNPCNAAQSVPATIPTFVETRPLIDWNHAPTGPARTGIFVNGVAGDAFLGAGNSPVQGSVFGGSASVGGVFYPYTDFPAPYANSYFFGDYTGGWIRSMTLDAANKPLVVRDFVGSGAVPVAFAVSPTETGLFYVNFFPSEIRKISYLGGGNAAPTAVASANKSFGPGPLAVQFTGSASTDPEGQPLTYAWDFGDGTTSALANPAHTFTPATAAPTRYAVTLTVTDNQGSTNQAFPLTVSVNNTPPAVTITSPALNTLYPITGSTTYNLTAAVTDAEHSGAQLTYRWQTILHHATHQHPNAVDTNVQTTTTLAPYGCGAETYYYRITLTVTDAAGLATTTEVRLDPDCTGTSFTLVESDTNEDVLAIANGAVINLAELPTRNLNIRANANPATTGSVVMALSGTQTQARTESVRPYALFGQVNGNYNDWTPTVGSYSLTGTPYSGANGTGTAGAPLTVAFTVTDSNPPAFTLAVSPGNGGTVSKSPDQPSYAPGTVVNLTAVPAPDFAFTGWGGSASGTANPLPLTMDGNKTVTATFAPVASGSYAFYRAVNLNGPAVTLDGHAWAGATAPNYTTNGTPYANQAVPLLPTTDAARATMIRDVVYGNNLSFAMTALPAGTYQMYAYVWEDNNPETFSLSVNGQVVLTDYNSGPAGTWQKLGPFTTTVTGGTLQLTIAGGDANLSGVELWKQTGTPPANQPPAANAGPDQALTLATGSTTLNATLSGSGTDPDGSIATYAWTKTSGPAATLSGANSPTLTASGLVAGTYAFRLIVTDNAGTASPADLATVVVNPAPVGGSYAFYRAVNLNGPAVTLDGNAWAGTTAPNYTTNGTPFASAALPLLPATDAARAGMIQSCVYGNPLALTLSALPAGAYQAYLYVWEDNNPETFSLSVNGQAVLTDYNSGPAGTWQKLGPYAFSLAAPGAVQLTASGGDANFSGVELWKQAPPAAQASTNTPTGTAASRQPTPASELTAQVYPNPSATGRFTVELSRPLEGPVTYTLLSPLGAVVATGQRQLTQPATTLPFDFSAQTLAAGVYYLRLEGSQRTVRLKLLRY